MSVSQAFADVKPDAPPDAFLLDVPGVAHECSVSAQTVRRWIAAGVLHPVSLPGGCRRVLVRRADVAAMVDSLSAS
jgi:hypothetical protein